MGPNANTLWMAWAQDLGLSLASRRAKPLSRTRRAVDALRWATAAVVAPRPDWMDRVDWYGYLATAMLPAFAPRPDTIFTAPCSSECGGGQFVVGWGEFSLTLHFSRGHDEGGGGIGLDPDEYAGDLPPLGEPAARVPLGLWSPREAEMV